MKGSIFRFFWSPSRSEYCLCMHHLQPRNCSFHSSIFQYFWILKLCEKILRLHISIWWLAFWRIQPLYKIKGEEDRKQQRSIAADWTLYTYIWRINRQSPRCTYPVETHFHQYQAWLHAKRDLQGILIIVMDIAQHWLELSTEGTKGTQSKCCSSACRTKCWSSVCHPE